MIKMAVKVNDFIIQILISTKKYLKHSLAILFIDFDQCKI